MSTYFRNVHISLASSAPVTIVIVTEVRMVVLSFFVDLQEGFICKLIKLFMCWYQ